MARRAARPLTSVAQLDLAPARSPFPSPADWRDQVLYEVMVDRFDDARPHPAYDPRSSRRRAPRRDPSQGNRFQGGRIRGITRRLDYIRGLGCTAIWVTPPLKNRPGDDASYAGYGAQDFLAIDPRFGTLADLRELTRQAHRRGMYVVMDVVIDHAGDVFAYADDARPAFDGGRRFPFGFWRRGGGSGGPAGRRLTPDDAVWPRELQSEAAFNRMGRIPDPSHTQGDEATDGDFLDLKALALEDPAVLSAVAQVYKYWIAAADVDGFRIDAMRHVRPESASGFCNEIREFAASVGKTNFLLVGEVASGGKEALRYVGMNTPLRGEGGEAHYPLLDAVLDFDLYNLLDPVLKGRRSPQALYDRYAFLERFYRDFGRAGRYYVTFLENHDQGSFPYRRFLADAPDPRLAFVASAFLLTSFGIPCLYYGTEQGFDGAGDTDAAVRECMFGGQWGAFGTTGHHFFNTGHPLYRAIARAARVRAAVPALRYGRQYFRETSADGVSFAFPAAFPLTLAYSRILNSQEVLVALNPTGQTRRDAITVDAHLSPAGTPMRDLLAAGARARPAALRVRRTDDGRTYVRPTLPPYGVAILLKQP